MKYKNKVTGAVIETESELRGAWEALHTSPVSLPGEEPEGDVLSVSMDEMEQEETGTVHVDETGKTAEKTPPVPQDKAKPKGRAGSKAKAGK